RRWVSRQWICCVLNFKGRRREVWGRSYTELFFLDEPTAFTAGHRPCFECRHKDAQTFAEKWREVHRYRKPPYAAEMDNVLHAERLRGRVKRLHRRDIDQLPDAAFIAFRGAAFAVRGDTLLHWTPSFNYPHLAEWSEERTKCCVTGIDRDSLSGTDSREERCRWTGKTTHGLIASLLAAVLSTSA